MADISTIKDRVTALLRKAADLSATEAEAQSALAAAQKLMAKYGFTEDDIGDATSDDYTEASYTKPAGRKNFDPVVRNVGAAVARFTGCAAFYMGGHNERMAFYGLEADVEYAQWLIASFQTALNDAWERYKRYDMPRGIGRDELVRERIGFVRGFCARIEERLRTLMTREGAAEQQTGNALVVKKYDLAQRRLEDKYGAMRSGGVDMSGKGMASNRAQGAGYMAGGAADVARGVSAGKAAIEDRR